LAWDDENKILWVAKYGDGAVQPIDLKVPDKPILGETMWVWDQSQTLVSVKPSLLVWDGTRLWVASFEDGTVTRMDPTGEEQPIQITIGSGLSALAWDGESLWVANGVEDKVWRIDPANGGLRDFQVGIGPTSLVWDGTRVWVANQGDGTVQPINVGLLNLIEKAQSASQHAPSPEETPAP
jgi:hypothetical protein